MVTSNHALLEPEHVNAIGALASETNRPLEEVAGMYAATLRKLRAGARIEKYLSVLVSKKVRSVLRENQRWMR